MQNIQNCAQIEKSQNRGDSWVVHLHHIQKSIEFNPKSTIYGHSFGGPPPPCIAQNPEELPVEKICFVKLLFCHIPTVSEYVADRLSFYNKYNRSKIPYTKTMLKYFFSSFKNNNSI